MLAAPKQMPVRRCNFPFRRMCRNIVLVLALSASLSPGPAAAQETLQFMAAGNNINIINLLQEELLPAFEREFGVRVEFSAVSWAERTDRLALLVASGLTPDVIGTAYYSPHEEGAQGLFLPLGPYLEEWEYTDSIPAPLWLTQTWRGEVYVVPFEIDMRGYAYNKSVFAEAGYDPDSPPQSWTELVEYARRLTRLSPDQDAVEVRGIGLWGPAGEFMSFMHQAGTPPVDLESFRSNFDRPAAVEAAEVWAELLRASRYELGGPNAGVAVGAVAMESTTPGSFAGYLDQVGGDLPTLSSELGVFYPRKDRESDPVALAFVNGLAIARTSKNPDLAWELIKYLMRDEVQQRIHETAGWMPPRVELASQFVTNPLLPAAYDAVQYLIAAQLPPPRNVSQNELDAWLYRVLRSEVPPEEAMLAVHDLWSRLLAEWGAAVSK